MSETYDPGDHTVDEVKEYVTENPDQAGAVLAAEQDGKNRSTLIEWLEEAAEGPQVAQNDAEAQEQAEAMVEEEPPPPPELPPALDTAGLVGVRALVSGQYTLGSGSSFWLSPGEAYAVSPEDADELIEAGAVASEAGS